VNLVKSTVLWLGVSLFMLQSSVQAEPIEFNGVDIYGKELRLSDYRGKWVLVNYWATWCMPCVKELPELEAFHNKHKESKAVVLGLNMESIKLEKLQGFVKDKSVTYPIVQVKMAVDTPFGAVYGMPTSFLINPKGEIAARESGVLTAKLVEDFIIRSEKEQGLPKK